MLRAGSSYSHEPWLERASENPSIYPEHRPAAPKALRRARSHIFVQILAPQLKIGVAANQSSKTSPRAGDVDGPPEGPRALVAGPLGVELVGDVREHDALGAGAARVVAGLLRSQVAPGPGALRPRQRGFDEQEVGVAGDVDQFLARAAVGAEGEAAVLRRRS